MRRLLNIEFIKTANNRAFWILFLLYFLALLAIASAGQYFLDFLSEKGTQVANIDPSIIPIYHFPDIWQNLTYIGGFFKFLLSLIVIVSVINDISFGTMRQHIIDGLSHFEFILSKIYLILFLSLSSTIVLLILIVSFGNLHTPSDINASIFTGSEFIFAYFLQLVVYLSFSLFLAMLIRKSVLTLGILFIYSVIIEPVTVAKLPDNLEWLSNFLPIRAIENLVHQPFAKYILQEIQDYVSVQDVLVAGGYFLIFTALTYVLMKKRDLH